MCQKLPNKDFKFCKDLGYINQKFIKNFDEELNEKGYILEVDIDYPKKLHHEHKDLPFLPEKIKINKQTKLTCNFYDKTRYVVHIKLLQQALNHGLKFKKLQRVTEFKQSAWMKEYIMLNIELRKKATNGFEKDFFKMMCNAVFGKTMQNVKSEKDIKLFTTNIQRKKLVNQPNFYSSIWFSNNLLAIEMKKVKVKMNKPIYLGMSIIDISKIPMYEFWYDYLRPKYKENLQLCYMDTDSYVFGVKTKDWYKDILNDIEERFDTSNIQINIPIKKV